MYSGLSPGGLLPLVSSVVSRDHLVISIRHCDACLNFVQLRLKKQKKTYCTNRMIGNLYKSLRKRLINNNIYWDICVLSNVMQWKFTVVFVLASFGGISYCSFYSNWVIQQYLYSFCVLSFNCNYVQSSDSVYIAFKMYSPKLVRVIFCLFRLVATSLFQI